MPKRDRIIEFKERYDTERSETKDPKVLVRTAILIFVLCVGLRIVDVFLIRSDEWFGELVLSKVLGIAIVIAYAIWSGYGLDRIGFRKTSITSVIWISFGLTAAVMATTFLVQFLFLRAQGANPLFSIHIQGFTLRTERFTVLHKPCGVQSGQRNDGGKSVSRPTANPSGRNNVSDASQRVSVRTVRVLAYRLAAPRDLRWQNDSRCGDVFWCGLHLCRNYDGFRLGVLLHLVPQLMGQYSCPCVAKCRT